MPILNKNTEIERIAGLGCLSDILETKNSFGAMHYLMFEMLILSFRDLMSENEKEKQEAIEWFKSEEDDYCFSFRNLASAMGSTPDDIRKKIVSPAINGNYEPILRIPKFAKVHKGGVLYEQ